MMTTTTNRRNPKPSEEGYVLVAVMFMLAILIIALTVAAPKIAKSIQRDRELETMRRGKQYARAVKLYYKQFNTFPPNLDALVKTNEIRYLRKKYIDPTTGKDEWKPIPYGQQKTQTLGFFGQPIGGAGMAGAGLNGGGLSGATPIGGTSASGGTFGSSTGSTFGSSSGSTFGSSSGSTPIGSTDAGSGTGASGTSTDPSSGSGGTNGGSGQTGGPGTGANSSTSTFGPQTGQTFGGMGIMGFSPTSPKQSILVYKKKNHYNEWEFLYDPVADQLMMMGGNTGAIGTPIGGANGTSPIGSGSTFGGSSGIGGSSFGSSGGTNPGGNTPTPAPPPPPQQPQQ
jgi:type II secretory pathway pseudopilin PulG